MLSGKITTLRRLGRALASLSKMSMGKEAKRQHSARLKNTEQKTRKRLKRQRFRAECEFDARTSQAKAKVYAPLGSYVGHVSNCSSSIVRLLPANEGKNGVVQRGRDYVVLAQKTRKNMSEDFVFRGR